MKLWPKITLFVIAYGVLLSVIYQTDNRDFLLMFLTLSLMVPIIYLIRERFKQQQTIDKLQQETLHAELNLLKSQINPHFFFNTLNNLYGLAIEKSELTQEVIYKLSQMMRFTIYEGRKSSVTVNDEIQYLQNFIELNQIRYKDEIDVHFKRQIEDGEQRIPPLLFINILENAYKHGADSQTHGQFIHFELKTTAKRIEFNLENNFDPQVVAAKKADKVGGLGIENLKRRLELLFPGKHQFISKEKGNSYICYINIDLT